MTRGLPNTFTASSATRRDLETQLPMAESCRSSGCTQRANQQAKIPSTLTPFVPGIDSSPIAGAAVPVMVAATETHASKAKHTRNVEWETGNQKIGLALGLVFWRLFPLPGRLWLVARRAPSCETVPDSEQKVEAGPLLVGLVSGYFHAIRQPRPNSKKPPACSPCRLWTCLHRLPLEIPPNHA